MKETRLLLLLSMLVGATLTGCPLTQDIEVGDMPDADPLPECRGDDACAEGERCVEGECVAGCFCPRIVAPVCGVDGITYGNECEAGCAGVAVEHAGECREPEPEPEPGPCGEDECGPSPFQREPCPDGGAPPQMCVRGEDGACGWQLGECPDVCACPEVFAPVCGADGETYGNACEARCAGVEVAHEGECRQPPRECRPVECGPGPRVEPCPDGDPPPMVCEANDAGECAWTVGECRDCACGEIFAPVCGADGATYPNACEARCAGVDVVHEGECREPDECREDECGPSPFQQRLCPDGSPPPQMCVRSADGACGWQIGACPDDPGPCGEDECGPSPFQREPCPDGNPPPQMCVRSADGVCGWQLGECPGQCVCPRVIDPVCGADGVTYQNACLANCAGVRVVHAGECRGGGECAEDECGPAAFLVALCPDGTPPPQVCERAADGVCGWRIGDCPDPPVECRPAECGPAPGAPNFQCPDGSLGGPICERDAAGRCGWQFRECPDDCACFDLWAPVCGVDGMTYGNDCEAQCAGVRVAHEGECGAVGECAEDACGPSPFFVAACPDGSIPPQACVVGADGVCRWQVGECPPVRDCDIDACGPPPPVAPCPDGNGPTIECAPNADGVCGWQIGRCEEVCVCPDVWQPVCGADGVTYGNACEARCAGVAVVADGECRGGGECAPDACGPAPFLVAPCPNGDVPPQQCLPAADGVCRWQIGECPPVDRCAPDACGAPPPVAACPDGNGPTVECAPNANGVCAWEIGRCDDCVCLDVWQPVCGADGVTYGNACEARCAGVEPVANGECGADLCALPPEPGPCEAAIRRWYYDPAVGQCQVFVWGGCGGNANNFATADACEAACGRGGAAECDADACGPAPRPLPCDDGSAPRQACLADAAGQCGWITECGAADLPR